MIRPLIVEDWPPNIAFVRLHFPVKPTTIFAYGGKIYNPSGDHVPESVVAHEMVHLMRQGDKPDEWWASYCADEQFRFLEELIAHRVEYRKATEGRPRHYRRAVCAEIAKRLASKLYGSLCSKETAKKLILEERDPMYKAEIQSMVAVGRTGVVVNA